MLNARDRTLRQESFRHDLGLISTEEYIQILEEKVKKLESQQED